MSKLNKKMRQLHKEYVKQNGNEPRFADVKVRWDGDDEDIDDIIKLKDFDPRNTENDPDDEHVIYFADGITELCQVNEGDHGFIITDINGFCNTY